MIKCDCDERYGIKIDSYQLFEDLKEFFEGQVDKGIFKEIPVTTPYYISIDSFGDILEWYADKLYKCNSCGVLWEFKYPDFPAVGEVRKFEDGVYPEPETNFQLVQWYYVMKRQQCIVILKYIENFQKEDIDVKFV